MRDKNTSVRLCAKNAGGGGGGGAYARGGAYLRDTTVCDSQSSSIYLLVQPTAQTVCIQIFLIFLCSCRRKRS